MPGVMAAAARDPTVCDAAEKAQIECYTGVSLRDAQPEALRFVIERSKQAGNEAFRQKNYKGAPLLMICTRIACLKYGRLRIPAGVSTAAARAPPDRAPPPPAEAVKLYSQAIAGDEGDHTLYGNRSAAYLALGLYEQALWDGRKAIALDGGWGKGYYRLGCAHMALSQWAAAAQALETGLELAPDAPDMAARLAQARARQGEEDAARRAAAATERRGLMLRLRAARREDQKLAMLNQFKQSMSAPDWELEDLEW
jgi:stress-induced-phosphoprotein 1